MLHVFFLSLSTQDLALLACEAGEETPEHTLTGSCIVEFAVTEQFLS